MPSDKIDRLLFAAMLWLNTAVLVAADRYRYAHPGPPRPVISGEQLHGVERSPVLSAANSVIRYFSPLSHALGNAMRQDSEEQAELGRMLFFDPRLSKSQQISCNSCHPLSRFGVDGRAFSIGHGNQETYRNTPTVLNTGGHALLFWDGRARSLEDQAHHPIFGPGEMAMPSEERLIETLSSMPEYRTAFARAFGDAESGIRLVHIEKALAAFQRKLVTPSRWDRFVLGFADELSSFEKEGFVKFIETGCNSCHSGSLFGGGSFERLGVQEPWPNQADSGRAEVTGQEHDRMLFKVPSLRNVAKTAPYFHDASADTLEQAVRMMARFQLGTVLSERDVRALVSWLGTLTGELPKRWITRPELPAATAQTPAADLSLVAEPHQR